MIVFSITESLSMATEHEPKNRGALPGWWIVHLPDPWETLYKPILVEDLTLRGTGLRDILPRGFQSKALSL